MLPCVRPNAAVSVLMLWMRCTMPSLVLNRLNLL